MYDNPILRNEDPAIQKRLTRKAGQPCLHCAQAIWSFTTRQQGERVDLYCYCQAFCDMIYSSREDVDDIRDYCSGQTGGD